MVEIGKMRHRVAIQSKSTSTDAYGQALDSWTTLRTVWAQIQPTTGREYERAAQMVADITHTITMRYCEVEPSNRLVRGSSIYQIKYVINVDELNHYVQLLCVEVV